MTISDVAADCTTGAVHTALQEGNTTNLHVNAYDHLAALVWSMALVHRYGKAAHVFRHSLAPISTAVVS